MRTPRALIPAVATALLGGALTSVAQDTERAQTDEQTMGGHMMGGDMMRMCHQMMMGGRMGGQMGQMGAMTMPQLPPGNEKLELQMRAEMMRKMAEVMEKYAGRIRQAEAASQN
jgi:hypothetical protein